MFSPRSAPQPCPDSPTLVALVEGALAEDAAMNLFDHLDECQACIARLDAIEEATDSLIIALSTMPASQDDEATFQDIQTTLLAHPEPFTGDLTGPNAFQEDAVPLESQLPIQLGNYELLEQIGAGAHGAVFRARHRRLEREVAVKLLMKASAQMVAEFLNEMRVIGKLDHPNIIRATDAGEHEGVYFLVMDFVPGLDVSSLLKKTGPMRIADACEIARQTAVGLNVAHQNDLVHRDVKTSNLLFTDAGQVKLLDLGLATFTSRSDAAGPNVDLGPRGTADYMAPEQWQQAPTITAQADIYSLGCTLYKMLVGHTPFRILPAGCENKQQAHESAAIPLVSDVRQDIPNSLSHLLARMLAKDPRDRPDSAAEVANALEKYAAHSELSRLAIQHIPRTAARRATAPVEDRSRSHNRRRFLVGGLAGSAALLAASLWMPSRKSRLQPLVWRQLKPNRPEVVPIASGPPAALTKGATFQVESEHPALVHLGTPIAKPFRWQSRLMSDLPNAALGVFFRLRRSKASESELAFHVIKLESPNPGKHSLVWCVYQSIDRVLSEPQILAETRCSSPATGAPITLEVTIGRKGFPEVKLDDQLYPASAWATAKEARDFIVISNDQLPVANAGRIGVFHEQGTTTCQLSRLMYLDV